MLSKAISVPQPDAPVASAPDNEPDTTSKQALWLGVSIGVIAILIGLVAFLALREPERTTAPDVAGEPRPTEPVEVPTMSEAAMEAPALDTMATAMETAAEVDMATAMESAMEEVARPSRMRRSRRAATEMSRMETAMEGAMETAMDGTMETMEASSWMGEIIGGGWSGEIIEGGQ